ncbi:hypothetical protein GS489_01275 [Rhodococcus hoagii]|nr:hypothetical protein [Prescottella equi]
MWDAVEHIHGLSEFKPEAFVTGTDSLHALSKEGPDFASALTQRQRPLGPPGRCGTIRVPMTPVMGAACGRDPDLLARETDTVQYIRTPQEAEANAALRMRELGFSDALVTVGGADGGIDVRASGALAQVKWRGGMVGRPELQNLFGARGNDFSKSLLFFAASDYSQHAVEYADSMSIALFVYNPDGTLVARNRHAQGLQSNPASPSMFGQFTTPFPTPSAPPAKSGFWAQKAWPFLKVHWRIVGAIFFTLGSMGGVGAVLNPDETMGETRLGNFGLLVMCIVCAVVFWLLYFGHREMMKRHRLDQDIV